MGNAIEQAAGMQEFEFTAYVAIAVEGKMTQSALEVTARKYGAFAPVEQLLESLDGEELRESLVRVTGLDWWNPEKEEAEEQVMPGRWRLRLIPVAIGFAVGWLTSSSFSGWFDSSRVQFAVLTAGVVVIVANNLAKRRLRSSRPQASMENSWSLAPEHEAHAVAERAYPVCLSLQAQLLLYATAPSKEVAQASVRSFLKLSDATEQGTGNLELGVEVTRVDCIRHGTRKRPTSRNLLVRKLRLANALEGPGVVSGFIETVALAALAIPVVAFLF